MATMIGMSHQSKSPKLRATASKSPYARRMAKTTTPKNIETSSRLRRFAMFMRVAVYPSALGANVKDLSGERTRLLEYGIPG